METLFELIVSEDFSHTLGVKFGVKRCEVVYFEFSETPGGMKQATILERGLFLLYFAKMDEFLR